MIYTGEQYGCFAHARWYALAYKMNVCMCCVICFYVKQVNLCVPCLFLVLPWPWCYNYLDFVTSLNCQLWNQNWALVLTLLNKKAWECYPCILHHVLPFIKITSSVACPTSHHPLDGWQRGWCIYQTIYMLHHLQHRSQGVSHLRQLTILYTQWQPNQNQQKASQIAWMGGDKKLLEYITANLNLHLFSGSTVLWRWL